MKTIFLKIQQTEGQLPVLVYYKKVGNKHKVVIYTVDDDKGNTDANSIEEIITFETEMGATDYIA